MARRFLGAIAAFVYLPGAGAGKVLTSDASGNGTWQTAPGGSDTAVAFAFFMA